MKKIQSLTDKRLVVKAKMNGKDANFLLDTGATVGLVSESIRKEYGLARGKKFPFPLVGAGGDFYACHCNTPADLEGKPLTQFLLADISSIAESVRRETGITLHGIISLPQMQSVGMQINTNDNSITLD